jgi:hypothetical protein
MIDWLTKEISKHESVVNNNRVKQSKEHEDLAREIQMITSERMNEFIILTMIISEEDYMMFHKFSSG